MNPFKIDWRPVVGFEGIYSVSACGLIRSEPRQCATKSGGVRDVRQRVLHPKKDPRGYLSVTLFKDGRRHYVRLHIAVLLAFVGPRPAGHEGAHNDGNPSNCALENLRWATHTHNCADKKTHGTLIRGEKHALAKLTEAKVLAIRNDNRLLKHVAADYGVTAACISDIRRGKTWSKPHA